MPKNTMWSNKEISELQNGINPKGRTKKACDLMRWKLRSSKFNTWKNKVLDNTDHQETNVVLPKNEPTCLRHCQKIAVSTGKTKAEACFALLDAKFSNEEVAKFLGIPLESVLALIKFRDLSPLVKNLI